MAEPPSRTVGVLSPTQRALLEAHERLKCGKGTGITDGRLTIENVAKEAGFSRATAYRCANLVSLFSDQANTGEHAGGQQTVEAEVAAAKLATERELRAVIRRLLNRIVILEHRERHLLEQMKKMDLEYRPGKSNVIVINNGKI